MRSDYVCILQYQLVYNFFHPSSHNTREGNRRWWTIEIRCMKIVRKLTTGLSKRAAPSMSYALQGRGGWYMSQYHSISYTVWTAYMCIHVCYLTHSTQPTNSSQFLFYSQTWQKTHILTNGTNELNSPCGPSFGFLTTGSLELNWGAGTIWETFSKTSSPIELTVGTKKFFNKGLRGMPLRWAFFLHVDIFHRANA